MSDRKRHASFLFLSSLKDQTTYFRFLTVMFAAFIAAFIFGCSGGGSTNPGPGPGPGPAAQVTLQSSAATIAAGQSATLTWTSANASSVSITPSVSPNPLPLSGSQTVTPAQTTTYTITATGTNGGTATASTTVSVTALPPPAAPMVTISANPSTINSGQTTSVTWTSENATSVNITPNILSDELPVYPLNGSQAITPVTTTTYVIVATGAGGATATASATVTVIQVPPTVQLTLSPTSIVAGHSATLSWSTNNAATLTIVGSDGTTIPVTTPAQGSVRVRPTVTTTYTATATSPAGLTATAMATLTVSNLSVSLTASPTSIQPGGSSILTYTSLNAVSLSIDNNVGSVNPPNGTVSVSPRVTTIYTITATDANGLTATDTATVSVNNGLNNIQHIIFFIQENRSFDNYFGKLGVYRANDPFTGQSYGQVSDVDGVPDDSAVYNVDPNGNRTHPFHLATTCVDVTSPSWDESHVDVNLRNGHYKMDGFVKVAAKTGGSRDPQGHRAIGYYDQRDLPYYYELATQYATSDRWFAPELANTIANRMYLFAATSYGTTYPEVPPPGAYLQTTIFEALNAAGVSWRYYFQDNSTFLAQYPNAWGNPDIRHKVRPISDYFTLLAGNSTPNGDSTLPKVVFIERGSGSADSDEHPDAEYHNGVPVGRSNQKGAAVAATIINAFLASSYYANSAFILSYDEPGGLYDHVPPQPATAPDDQPPSLQSPDGHTVVIPGDFKSTGMRLPFILISPYAKAHFVSHTVRDNTAILKFIEDRFLPGTSLTARDAAQPDMLEFFDFSNPSLLTPPALPVQPTTGTCDPAQESH